MTIYWSMNSVPELDGLEKSEKRQRFKELFKAGRKQIGMARWIALFAFGVAVFIGMSALGLGGALMGGVAGGIIGLAFVIFIQTPAIEHGRVWYRAHYGDD